MKYLLVGTPVFLVQEDEDDLYPTLVSDSINRIKIHYTNKLKKEIPDIERIDINYIYKTGTYDEMSFKLTHKTKSISYESIWISKVDFI